MKRFFTFTFAALLAVVISPVAWSQNGGASGSAGTAGATGTAGAAGTARTAAPGTAGATGTATGAAAAQQPAPQAAPGTAGTGIAAGINGSANVNARPNNMAARGATAEQFNGYGITPTPFFNDPGVRQQLSMNANQYRALDRTYQNAYARYNRALNNLSPNLPEQQRMARIQQLQANFNRQLGSTATSTFTNPEMLERYNQLNRQYMGFNAFNNPTVQRQLSLTPEQLQQIRALSTSWRQEVQQFRQGVGNNVNNINTNRWNQLWTQYQTRLNAILTPQQQQIWARQIGQPYAFSPYVYFPQQTRAPYSQTSPSGTVPDAAPNNNAAQPAQTPAGTRAAANPGTATQGNEGGTVR